MTMLVLFALAEICVAQEAVTTSLTATTIDDVTTPKRKRVTRLDRKLKSGAPFGYKGEFLVGLTASYGTLSSEDSD